MRFLVRLGLALLFSASLGLLFVYGLMPDTELAARIAMPNYGLEEGEPPCRSLRCATRLCALGWRS
jgi:hypothetical protein